MLAPTTGGRQLSHRKTKLNQIQQNTTINLNRAIQITQNNQNKLNPGWISPYDLRPGNGVMTILVEREEMDKSRKRVKQTKKKKGKSKMSKRWESEWTREEKDRKGVPQPHAESSITRHLKKGTLPALQCPYLNQISCYLNANGRSNTLEKWKKLRVTKFNVYIQLLLSSSSTLPRRDTSVCWRELDTAV